MILKINESHSCYRRKRVTEGYSRKMADEFKSIVRSVIPGAEFIVDGYAIYTKNETVPEDIDNKLDKAFFNADWDPIDDDYGAFTAYTKDGAYARFNTTDIIDDYSKFDAGEYGETADSNLAGEFFGVWLDIN